MKTVAQSPLVSIVIPTHNRVGKLLRLLDTIEDLHYDKSKIEVIVIDDASDDNTYEMVSNKYRDKQNFCVLRNEQVKLVSEARNKGIKKAKGQYIFFVDDDVYLQKDTVSELVGFLEQNNEYAALGPLICEHRNPDKIWSAGARMNFWTVIAQFPYKGRTLSEVKEKLIRCDCLLTCFMVRKEIIEKIGYFNSALLPFFHEELDFCVRIKLLRYPIGVLSSARVWHDRVTAALGNNYNTYYYGTRSVIIAHTLWSQNSMQHVISRIFATTLPFCGNIIKTAYNKNTYPKKISAMVRGIRDGVRISRNLKSYKTLLNENKSIAFRE